MKSRLLFADDELSSCNMIKRILRREPFALDFAHSGPDALQLAVACNYAVIFLDLHMPVMDGIEVVSALRGKGIGTPVIALSGSDAAEMWDKCESAGMNGYLAKPYHRDDLLHLIRLYCSHDLESAGRHKNDIGEITWLDTKRIQEELGLSLSDYLEILQDFMDVAPGYIEGLRRAMTTENRKEIFSNAHAVKGAALNMFLDPIAAIAAQIENCVENDSIQDLPNLVRQINTELERLCADFRSHSDEHGVQS